MSLYGNNFYNLFTYGRDALVEFDAQPFIANSIDYASIQLNWELPSGAWNKLLLVRNNLGFPVTPDDGDLLLDTTTATSYLDRRIDPVTGAILDRRMVEGKTYYYSIFVRRTSDSKWFTAALNMGTAAKNYGTADLMYSYLPFMYRALSINGLSSDTGGINTDLYNFIRLFAFEYDKFKTDAENVKARYDIANLNGRLIPVMMNQFGFAYEQEMGLQQGRRLLQSAIDIYNTKGSAAGLKTFVAAFSGYNATLAAVKNLMLNINNSSFEQSVGGWNGVTNVTLSSITGASESPAVAPYLESTSPANYPNATTGVLKAVITAAATASFSCGETTPTTLGIPITAGNPYAFTIYSRAKTDARSVSVNIKWYDRFGVYISAGTAVTSTNSTSAWSRTTVVTATAPGGSASITNVAATTSIATFTGTNNFIAGQKVTITGLTSTPAALNLTNVTIATASGSDFTVAGTFTTLSSTAVSGATAVIVSGQAQFAVPTVSIASGGAGEIHYFDAAQFEAGSSATDYVDARRIDIKLGANRINLAKNPSFESVTTNWAATGAALTTDASGAITGSSASLKVTATGASAVVSQSESLVSVTAGSPYTLSGYAKSANTDSVTPSVLYYNIGGTLISTSTGTTTALNSSTWTRVSIVSTAPATAVSAKLVFTYATANTRINYLDAVMFEAASYVQTYFDGSTGYYKTDDLLWEDGSAVNGRSLYYRNRVNVTTRLATVLPDYVPYGARWALFAGIS
jgi:hypothetical protein